MTKVQQLDIAEVCDLIEAGDILKNALEKVAKSRDIKFSTLRSAYHRKYPQKRLRRHKLFKLSKEQEMAIIYTIIGFSSSDVPLGVTEVRLMVQSEFGVDVSPTWVTNFTKRYKD